MNKALVIIPTYNEIENIDDIIAAVLEQNEEFDVLIVDDGSPDGTGARVKELQAETSRIHLIEREGKLGLGTAYLAGFEYGIKNKFDFIFEMDADFSHPPKDLNNLYAACQNGADVAVGSRYTKGGGVKDWSNYRLFLSRGASLYVRMITFMPIMDPTAGFKCYKRKVLETIDLTKIKSIGYAFQIEMKYAAYRNGFKIVEVPIIFADREKGTSKMDTSIIKEAITGVLSMRWKGLKGYYKSK
ncbi:MAG: polyprenol monophosphomannose synthase [Saprospiraceae bacterium]|nr:polyprenol monophosphomannose synthase [Saprospiraceae bacterium]